MAKVTILKGVSVPLDKHEIILSGPEVAKSIEEEGFSDSFFELKHLNYISINAGMKNLPPKFGQLDSLTSLVLHSNKFQSLPGEIGLLKKLKHLDVSRNCLTKLPDELMLLSQLSSLNVSMNALTSLPSLRENVKLSSLNASSNKLEKFPDCCYIELSLLSEIVLSSNQIVCIPNEINKLASLKSLDLSSNKIVEVPPELSFLIKLKELNLKGNALKDNRLKKMIDQCHSKKVIDYIRHTLGKQTGCHAERKESLRSSFSEDKENKTNIPNEPVVKPKYVIKVVKCHEKAVNIMISPSVKAVRAGIICCIIRNVKFTNETFQKFIQVQNKFHDTVCEKRTKATLGTHDLKNVVAPLKYTALLPEDANIIPLGSSESVTVAEFIANKKLEIEQLKREKKRSWNSGIYQYLPMLKDLKEYPFVIDSQDRVISFPPIINSEISKVSVDTTDMLIEITSTNDKKLIREIMDKFIKEVSMLRITDNTSCGLDNEIEEDVIEGVLKVEQVSFIPAKGPKFDYPSDSDLNFPPSSIFMRKSITE